MIDEIIFCIRPQTVYVNVLRTHTHTHTHTYIYIYIYIYIGYKIACFEKPITKYMCVCVIFIRLI